MSHAFCIRFACILHPFLPRPASVSPTACIRFSHGLPPYCPRLASVSPKAWVRIVHGLPPYRPRRARSHLESDYFPARITISVQRRSEMASNVIASNVARRVTWAGSVCGLSRGMWTWQYGDRRSRRFIALSTRLFPCGWKRPIWPNLGGRLLIPGNHVETKELRRGSRPPPRQPFTHPQPPSKPPEHLP